MGQYTAPTFALGYYKCLQDNTIPDGTVLIDGVRCVDFVFIAQASTLYDGAFGVDLQKLDGTYINFVTSQNEADSQLVVRPPDIFNTPFLTTVKYPWVVRITGNTHPTLGEATGWLITTPSPANPLF